MSSFPCKSAYRSESCPPLSDSDDDEERGSKGEGNTEGGVVNDESDALVTPPPECLFVDQTSVLGTRTESIAKLEKSADELKLQIENIHMEMERVANEIRDKKKCWLEAILKVVEFEKSIQGIELSISDKLHHFQERIIDLESKRMENFKNSGDRAIHDLLENEIDEVKEEFEKQADADDNEKNEMTTQGQVFAASLGDVTSEYLKLFEEALEEAKTSKSRHTVEDMKEEFYENMALLENLLKRPAKFCVDEGGDRFYLDSSKEKVFKLEHFSSEYKLTGDGGREKVKDGFSLYDDENGEYYVDKRGRKIYTKFYFEDEFGRFFIDVHGNRKYKVDSEASEYELVNGVWKKTKAGTYAVDEKGSRIRPRSEIASDETEEEALAWSSNEKYRHDDVNYIKEAVGPAIRKALAAVALHQPLDPINYFANFLLHYRSNQHMFEKRDEEVKQFIELRDKMKEQTDAEAKANQSDGESRVWSRTEKNSLVNKFLDRLHRNVTFTKSHPPLASLKVREIIKNVRSVIKKP